MKKMTNILIRTGRHLSVTSVDVFHPIRSSPTINWVPSHISPVKFGYDGFAFARAPVQNESSDVYTTTKTRNYCFSRMGVKMEESILA